MLVITAGMDQKDRHVASFLFTYPLCATTGAVGLEVQKTADFPQLQLNRKFVHVPGMTQRPFLMVQTVWLTTEIPQLLLDKVLDVPVLQVVLMSQVVDMPVVFNDMCLCLRIPKTVDFPKLQSIEGRRHSCRTA